MVQIKCFSLSAIFTSVIFLALRLLSQRPLGPQMANGLSFVFTVMLKTEGCDISQEDVCAHRSLACLGGRKCHACCWFSVVCSHETLTGSLCYMSTRVKSDTQKSRLDQRTLSMTEEECQKRKIHPKSCRLTSNKSILVFLLLCVRPWEGLEQEVPAQWPMGK